MTTGNQIAKLTAADAGEEGHFGRSVAISGDTVLIGSPPAGFTPTIGSAYLFEGVIPEPSTLLLSTVACMGLFLRRNR